MANSGGKKTLQSHHHHNSTNSNSNNSTTQQHCFICATANVEYWAVGPCGHPYCALCAFRMRTLLSTTACPMCKSDHKQVFISKSQEAKFDGLTTSKVLVDDKFGMVFESADCKSAVMAWLHTKCALCCQRLATKGDLKEHLQVKHRKLLCELCLLHKPVFSFELQLFNHQNELFKHQNDGRRGHPMCSACKDSPRFYSEDELILHCRDKHESCPICTRRGNAASAYFADISLLQQHFEQKHFVCTDPVCLELKFVVFESEVELKVHNQSVHLTGKKMSKSQLRAASRINLTFTGEDSYSHSHSHSPTNTNPNTMPSDRRVTRTEATPAPTVNRAFTQQYNCSSFMFDAQLEEGHAQSMAMLNTKNKEFQDYLDSVAIDAGKKKALQVECRKFQSGRMSAVDLVHWMSTVPEFELKPMAPRLLELLLDRLKQLELERAFDKHFKLQDAFPSLPSTKTKVGANFNGITTMTQGKGRSSNEPIRGRILSHDTLQKPGRPPLDPMKNPLLLLGTSHNNPKSKKTYTLPTKAHSKPSCETMPTQANPNLTKPTLKNDSYIDDDSSGSSTFTIGQTTSQQLKQQEPESKSQRKKKGSILMRFGGLSNPLNNT